MQLTEKTFRVRATKEEVCTFSQVVFSQLEQQQNNVNFKSLTDWLLE